MSGEEVATAAATAPTEGEEPEASPAPTTTVSCKGPNDTVVNFLMTGASVEGIARFEALQVVEKDGGLVLDLQPKDRFTSCYLDGRGRGVEYSPGRS